MRKVIVEDSGFFLRCTHVRTVNLYKEYVPQTTDVVIPTIFQEAGKEDIEIK